MRKIVSKIELLLSGGAMVIAVAATFMNVICRYCFNRPIYQAEEIATSMFVWLVFIGASACYGENMHVGIDCIINVLPANIRYGVKLVTDVMLIGISAVMAYLAVVITISARMKLTSALRISYSFIDAAAAIGFILITFHAIDFLIRDLKSGKEEGEKMEGGEA